MTRHSVPVLLLALLLLETPPVAVSGMQAGWVLPVAGQQISEVPRSCVLEMHVRPSSQSSLPFSMLQTCPSLWFEQAGRFSATARPSSVRGKK